MNLTKHTPVLNYRTCEIDRIAAIGTNKATGEVEKIRTTTGQVWAIADLQPSGPIVDPLDKPALDTCLLIIRECCLSDTQQPEQAAQDLSLLSALTDEQKRQVWGQLAGSERRELRELKKKFSGREE